MSDHIVMKRWHRLVLIPLLLLSLVGFSGSASAYVKEMNSNSRTVTTGPKGKEVKIDQSRNIIIVNSVEEAEATESSVTVTDPRILSLIESDEVLSGDLPPSGCCLSDKNDVSW